MGSDFFVKSYQDMVLLGKIRVYTARKGGICVGDTQCLPTVFFSFARGESWVRTGGKRFGVAFGDEFFVYGFAIVFVLQLTLKQQFNDSAVYIFMAQMATS
jgi:hypothetical protein